MNAGEAVRGALAAALRAEPALAGVALFEGDAPPAVLPRIEVAEPQGIDWSAKGFRGRELRTAVTVRVAEGQRGRLGTIAAAVERAGEELSGDAGGWRIVNAVFLRSRGADEKGGVRMVLVEHRVRVVEV